MTGGFPEPREGLCSHVEKVGPPASERSSRERTRRGAGVPDLTVKVRGRREGQGEVRRRAPSWCLS